MKPIEIIDQNIDKKFECLLEIVDDREAVLALRAEYELATIDPLCVYHMTKNSDPYMRVLIGKNFIARMDALYANAHTDNIAHKKYAETPVEIATKEVNYYVCECGGTMNVYPQHSEMRCNTCHRVQTLVGTVFTDVATESANKRGSYETSRHCRFHLERILALHDPNIPEETYEQIRTWLRNNGKYNQLKLLKCKEYRRCLKEIKKTEWNDDVPFIRRHISGVSPERLYQDEMSMVQLYFDIAASTYAQLNEGSKPNLKFYPYFIFKILQLVLKNDVARFRSIAECIHFQSDDTIVANDRVWMQICENVKHFTYVKTDVNLLFE